MEYDLRFCDNCPALYVGNGQCDAPAGMCRHSRHDARAPLRLERKIRRRQRHDQLRAAYAAEMAAREGDNPWWPAAGASTPAAQIAGRGPLGGRPAPAAAVNAAASDLPPPGAAWSSLPRSHGYTESGDPAERMHRLLRGPVREALEEMPGGTLVTDAVAAGIVLELVRRCMAASVEGAAGGSRAPAPQ